jgi:adenylate cyclase
MLCLYITFEGNTQHHEHKTGILEIGRGPQRQTPRIVVQDRFVSRDHVQLEELSNGRVRIANLSQSQDIRLPENAVIARGANKEMNLPVTLAVGQTEIIVEAMLGDEQEAAPALAPARIAEDPTFDKQAYLTIAQPSRLAGGPTPRLNLNALGNNLTPETITTWLETVIGLQRSAADAKEFFDKTAKAVVELIGLELGMVLLQKKDKWDIVGYHAANDRVNSRYSRTLLKHVVQERRTFYQDYDNMQVQTQSLANVDAVVVSPIFGLNDEVSGVLYGSRTWKGIGRGNIRPLEAQVVQLLAAAVGDNLARTAATRTRAQFEQFFSPELVRELERNPALLEGRNQEVTILVSDLRGFTNLSERLGPETTCRIVRDIMERLSDQIVAHGGVIVDYAGDGILAMWNAPVAQADHAARACKAALAMLAEMPGLNTKWQETVGNPMAIGVGINTGEAQVGNTGSSRKLKYGPHGLTVNLASRVQDATKKVGAPLLISDAVRTRLAGPFTTKSVGTVELKGISEPVELFALSSEPSTTLIG